MANTFKSASVSNVGTSAGTFYTCGAGKTTVVLGAAVANKSGNIVAVTLNFVDSSASVTTQLLPAVQIPPNTTLEVLAGQKYILEAGDYLTALADTASSIDITMGIMEIS